MFGAIFAVTVLAVGLFGALRLPEHLAVPWAAESREGQSVSFPFPIPCPFPVSSGTNKLAEGGGS